MEQLIPEWEKILACTVGFLFSWFVGHAAVKLFRWVLGTLIMRLPETKDTVDGTHPLPAVFMGFFERTLFTTMVAVAGPANLPPVVLVMGAWLGLKLATNWNRRDSTARDLSADGVMRAENERRITNTIRGSQLALLSGVISLAIATIGGLICRATLFVGQ